MEFGLILALVAGAMIPLGGVLAALEGKTWWTSTARFHHAVTAVAGGALISAVALVLVPEGSERLPVWASMVFFALGGGLFAWMNTAISRSGGSRGQLVAMVADFLPEAVALGALLASGSSGGIVVAAIIALQNLPEGYNAFFEAAPEGRAARRRLLISYCGIALLGPVATYLGFTVFAEADFALGAMMMVAAGGILYLVFQVVAPKAALNGAWMPPLGAVLGFGLGLMGHLLAG
ncbi:MAG: divalent cation transporter [Pseudomonadota bacterium]